MMQRVKTAVVILNWNGKSLLERFLPSVMQNMIPDSELWVVDNASVDDSVSFLSKTYPEIKTLVFSQNYGFAGGYNRALHHIEADYFILLNSDVEVSKDWLSPLMTFMDENPDYGACQPKIRSFNEPDKFEYAGACGGFVDYLGYPFCRGRLFSETENDAGQYDDVVDVFWATGACLVIRSNLYRALGGLDELFFAHMEEIDLCWRIWNYGSRIAVVPSAVVYHVGGGSLPRQSARKTYLNFRNNHYLIYKNYPRNAWRKLRFKRWRFDVMAAVKFALDGHFADFFAVFRAIKHFHKTKHQLNCSLNDDLPSIIYKGSIVNDFYFKGKKKFSDLDQSLFC